MIEDYIQGIHQDLFISPAISSFKILRSEVGEEDGYIRIKCILSNGDVLEFAEYFQVCKNRIYIETYSFHWQAADGGLIKRWDNVKHHKEIDTFPHHTHLSDGRVVSSTPMALKKVLIDIEKTIPFKTE
jgi:hypothetical protein